MVTDAQVRLIDRVTVEELDRIHSRMPTPKLFGAKSEPGAP